MPNRNEHHTRCQETFHQAPVEFQGRNGDSLQQTAAELEFASDPSELETWKKKLAGRPKSTKGFAGMAQLRAENEALRNQILTLQIQWDILRTTLGVLSTTVGTRDVT
jgi:hypothetical protein